MPKARSKLWPEAGLQRDALESHVRAESFALEDLWELVWRADTIHLDKRTEYRGTGSRGPSRQQQAGPVSRATMKSCPGPRARKLSSDSPETGLAVHATEAERSQEHSPSALNIHVEEDFSHRCAACLVELADGASD